MIIKYKILIIVSLHALFATPFITMNNVEYNIEDIYKEYGKNEWQSTSKHQKEELINDFINRRLAVIESSNMGFKNKPDIAKKLYDRNHLALINATYEELVAKPLVSNDLIEKTKKYIVEERLLHHILISYNLARVQTPSERSKNDALVLAQKISDELNGIKTDANQVFADYAIQYSEDPTVLQNEGQLDWITWGRTVPSFQESAFKLQAGTFSNPVLTDFGYHIIYCEKVRPSEYASLNQDELDNIVYMVAKNSIASKLKPAATKYDSLQLSNSQLNYNDKNLALILEKITEQIKKNKISGQYKLDLIKLFEEMPKMGMVAQINGKIYGIKWFAEKLGMIPSGRHPQISDMASLKQALNIIVLQHLAIQNGYANNVHLSINYLEETRKIEQSLLYDQYLKWLVNNAKAPTKEEIEKYYNNNKEEKYFEDKKVSIREIKVLNKTLADSLYLEIKYGTNFNQLALEYSKTNPSKAGLINPFEKGKYNQMGVEAFKMTPGDVSDVIENLDRSYSIIKVEEFIDPDYIPIENVYNRIESILKRQNQNIAKIEGLKNLQKKYNVIINWKAL